MRTARSILPAILALLPLAATGCVHRGFFTDGTSVSLGKANRGILRGGRELPLDGAGYVVPTTWRQRGNRYGVDELVDAIERAAAHVEEEVPGSLLGVGDLSQRGGGRMVHHKSHENGRDADLIFFSTDDEGHPLPPPNAMPRYTRHLEARAPRDGWPLDEPHAFRRYFDVRRNWALVAALLEDRTIDVEYLFISNPLREALLTYAGEVHAPDALIARARVALRNPGRRALPHDDHLHLRIRCPASDRFQGCVDEGAVKLRVVERVKGPKVS